MKKSALFLGVLVVILIFGVSGSPAYAQTPSPQLSSSDYVSNKIIVKYKKGQSRAKIQQDTARRESQRKTFFGRAAQQMGDIVARVRGETLPEEKLGRIQNAEKKFGVSSKRLSKVKPDDELTLAESTSVIDVPQAVNEFKKLPEVEYAEPDFIAHAVDIVPNDPDFAAKQWGPQKIQAPKAWDIATGSADLIIGVVDTGVRLNHPDLAGKIIPGYDFYNNDSDPTDDYGHGTHVAGIISAVTNNAVGMAGVSWQGKILPVKVCSRLGSCPYDVIADGIEYAVDNGAKIINISLGGYNEDNTLKGKIGYAYNKGVLVVAAAGNDGNTNINYPAKYANVVAVGATNNDVSDTRAWFSNYGTELDIVAPGVNIWSTVTTSGSLFDPTGYRNLSGTSMSTPHVAGAAALLLAKYPDLKPGTYNPSNPSDAVSETLSYYLYHGAEDRGAAGRDDTYGWGRLDVYNSLQLPQVTPTPTYTATPPITSLPPPPTTPTWGPSPTPMPTSSPSGLSAYWKMDELNWTGLPGEVKDSSGNGKLGRAFNGVTTTVGKFGNSGNFDGTDDYVKVETADIPSQTGTVALWVKPTYPTGYTGTGTIISAGYPGNDFRFQIGWYPNTVSYFGFNINNVSYYAQTKYKLVMNSWTHLALTWDSTGSKLYINGTLIGSNIFALPPFNQSGIEIGRLFTGSFNFKGLTDDLRIYNRALTSSEILDLYKYIPDITPTPTAAIITPTSVPTLTPTLHPTITPSPKPTILPTFTPSPSSLTVRLSFDILPKNYNPQLTIWFIQNGKIIKEEKAQTYYDGSVFPPMKAIIYNSPVGTFDIKIKTDRHLSRKQTGVILKQGSNQVAFDVLISGDMDAGVGKFGDDEINLLDYNRMLTEWGKSGKFVSDLNYSEKVDSLDYDLLTKNYNKTGEDY